MTKKIASVAAIAAALLFFISTGTSQAEDPADIEAVRAELQKMIPSVRDAEIVKTAATGVYRIEIDGSYAYAFVDGKYVLLGDLYDADARVNLGDQERNKRMAEEIAEVPASKMIVFGPEQPKRVMTVFTDIDCGYCRKLHREVPALNEAGVQVRYLAFPRSGIGRPSYNKYVSVWCSDDQQKAMTSAKAGDTPESRSCENPIAESYKLGQRVGVTGTPTIIFDDGTVTPGYLPSAVLLQRLGIEG